MIGNWTAGMKAWMEEYDDEDDDVYGRKMTDIPHFITLSSSLRWPCTTLQ